MSEQNDGKSESRPLAELLTLWLSVAVVVGMVGAASWIYVSGADEPPIVNVTIDESAIRAAGGNYYVPITVRNDGDRTVADARVQGTLTLSTGTEEQADITITYLAGGELAPAELIFGSDPRNGDLEVSAISYVDP